MLRVISELRPAWVVGENVAGIVNMALDQVYADLENEGYAVQALIIPACAVDAPHRRDRCAILAHADGGEQLHREPEKHPAETGKHAQREPIGRSTNVAHAESIGLQRERTGGDQIGGTRPEKAQPERRCDVLSDTDNGCRTLRRDGELPAVEETGESRTDHGGRTPEYVAGEWRATQPGLGGMVDGFSYWLDEPAIQRIATGITDRANRLKCLGNAVVPQQFYPVFQAIADIDARLAWNTRAPSAEEMEMLHGKENP